MWQYIYSRGEKTGHMFQFSQVWCKMLSHTKIYKQRLYIYFSYMIVNYDRDVDGASVVCVLSQSTNLQPMYSSFYAIIMKQI